MTQKEVMKLCIDAVLSKASKQNPVIEKVKYWMNSQFISSVHGYLLLL